MPESITGKPVGLYLASDGKIYVPDTHYHRVLIFDREGRELARFGEEGTGPGQFQLPTDIVRDAAGNIYVGEYGGNDRIDVFSPDLQFQYAIGEGEVAGMHMSRPAGLDIDAAQTLWVADAVNHRVLHFTLKGELLAAWGSMGRESGQMRYPYDLVCLPNGQILVCEFENNRLQWFDATGKSLRTWGTQGRRPGELWAPWGISRGPDGRIYVVDALNSRVQILRS
jgi:DNA-binding beta-propeller fold protein YncE